MEIELYQSLDQALKSTWVFYLLTKMSAHLIKKNETIKDLKRQLRAEKAKTWWDKLLRR